MFHSTNATMSDSNDNGEVAGENRLIALPSLSIKNLVKFHLIEVVPRMPFCLFLNQRYNGIASAPVSD